MAKVMQDITLPSGEVITIPTLSPDQRIRLNGLDYMNFNDFLGLGINSIAAVFGTKALIAHSAACLYMTLYDAADDSFLNIMMPGGSRIYGALGAMSEVTPSGRVLIGTGTAGHEMWIVDMSTGTVQTLAMPQGVIPGAVAWGYNFCISPFLAGTTRCFVTHGQNGVGANFPRAEVDVETGVVTPIDCPNTVNYVIGSLNMIMNGDKIMLPTNIAGKSFMYKFSTKEITQLPDTPTAVVIAPNFTHSDLAGTKMLMGSNTSTNKMAIFDWDTETWSEVTMPSALIWGNNNNIISPVYNGIVCVDNSAADTTAAFVDIINGTVTPITPAAACIIGALSAFSEFVGSRCLASVSVNRQAVTILDFSTKAIIESDTTGWNTVYGAAQTFSKPRNGRIIAAANNANNKLFEVDVVTGAVYIIDVPVTATWGQSHGFVYLTPDLILLLALGQVQLLLDYRDTPSSNMPKVSSLARYLLNVTPSSQAAKQAYGQAFKSGITGGSDGNGYNRVRAGNKQLFFSATMMALAWLVDVNKL